MWPTSSTITTTILRPFFQDHPGKPVPEKNFWILWCKGRLTEHTNKENKSVGSQQSWSKEGTVRCCQSKEASILWSYHEETRELPGERNNARCMQARKTTNSLDRQHQVVDRTPCGRVNQNDRGQR